MHVALNSIVWYNSNLLFCGCAYFRNIRAYFTRRTPCKNCNLDCFCHYCSKGIYIYFTIAIVNLCLRLLNL